MFPQEPHSCVGGCTNNLTQTTENRSSQARVRGYYYVPSLAIEHGSLSLALPLREQFVDTSVLQVYASFMHQHMRRLLSKRNTSMPCVSGRMQANGLVPYLLSATNTVIRISSTYLFCHRGQKAEMPLCPSPIIGRALSSQSLKRRWDFPYPFVKRPISPR